MSDERIPFFGTIAKILAAVNGCQTGATPLDIVYTLWPTTKQPSKKAKTVTKYARQLCKAGHLRLIGEKYFITPTSRQAYKSMTRAEPQPFMRLAK